MSLATEVDAEYKRRLLFYKPHDKQRQFHALGASCRERLFLAGNRVGKTFGGSVEVTMHLTGIYPSWWTGRRFVDPVDAWAASVTGEATRDILQNEYLGNDRKGTTGLIHPSLIVDRTRRTGIADAIDTAFVKHVSGKVSQLGFKSYDQGREKFQGTRKQVIHLDEEPPLDIYDECFMRTAAIGGAEQGVVLMTMTPLQGLTELIHGYTENRVSGQALEGKVFIQAGWEDNPHISAEERADLMRRFASRPHELEARMKGVPSLGSGMIYPVTEESVICHPFDIPDTWKRCFGMDFGWTNPTAGVWLAINPDTDIAYAYSEYAQSELSPQTHANNILTRGAWIPGVCDPAGQAGGQADGEALIEKYEAHGLRLQKADNSVESGIQEVLERFQNGRLKIFSTCEGLLSERRMYARDEKGRVIKKNDHRLDALRYAVVTGLSIARIKPANDNIARRRVVVC